jgi:hypothetical protein
MTPLEEALKKKLEELERKNATLVADNQKLVAENARLVSPDFVPHMGALWKRSGAGFESYPYCAECPKPSVMRRLRGGANAWGCSSGHLAPLGIRPPTA